MEEEHDTTTRKRNKRPQQLEKLENPKIKRKTRPQQLGWQEFVSM
jgi:hypothetical protein